MSKYDDQGNVIEEVCFSIDGKPCLCNNGYAKRTWKYDDQGNEIEEAYFGIDDLPCLHKKGYSKITMKYDEQGDLINRTYFDIHGKELVEYVSAKNVPPDSNGGKWGIQEGDFLILYDGQQINDVSSFNEKRSQETGDDPHELLVLRDKEFVAVHIRPGLLGCSLSMKPLPEEQQKLVSEKLKEVKKD